MPDLAAIGKQIRSLAASVVRGFEIIRPVAGDVALGILVAFALDTGPTWAWGVEISTLWVWMVGGAFSLVSFSLNWIPSESIEPIDTPNE